MPLPEHGKNWVVLRWNIDFGFYYIGPFQNADIAADWAEKNDGCDVNWVVAHLDPPCRSWSEPQVRCRHCSPTRSSRSGHVRSWL
jgi:hypothetical protein